MRRNRTDQENRFIYTFIAIVVVMLIVALYGCLSGGWENAASQ